VVGLYVTYHRKEDAGRCIAAVDGVQSPGGGRDIMRASYGTTKYCLAFLRGVPCNDHNCMNLHEWGDEKDYFTKEDLATLYVFSSFHARGNLSSCRSQEAYYQGHGKSVAIHDLEEI
jgi:CCR4-NOT transcription complex subunit 4